MEETYENPKRQVEINWKKNFFAEVYKINAYGKQIGELKDKTFSKTATAVLNDRHYSFRTTGFFQQHTEIRDEAANKVIGEITYGTSLTKATININGEVTHWKYTNTWNTKWRVFNDRGVEINYRGSAQNGTISSNTEDPLLILSGLFITHYFWQIALIFIVAIFIPILLTN